MPIPSSRTVRTDDAAEDEAAELVSLLSILAPPLVPPAPAPPLPLLPPTTTVTVRAPAEAAFLTSSSTHRPREPMTVPARTDAAEAADICRRRLEDAADDAAAELLLKAAALLIILQK